MAAVADAARPAPGVVEPPDVESMLPHAHPMILIDRVMPQGPSCTRAAVRIHEDTMFCEMPSGVPAFVGVEYIAQTVAAHAGLRARRAGQPVRIGFLLGTRRYDCAAPCFPPGTELTIEVVTAYEGPTVSQFSGVIFDARGGELARGAVTVYVRKGVAGEA